jgi:hypothetical protein
MAKSRFTDPIGSREHARQWREALAVQCNQRLHEVIMNVDHLPGDVTVPFLGRRWCARNVGPSAPGRQFAFRAINAFIAASITTFWWVLSVSAKTRAPAACNSSRENFCPSSIIAFPFAEASSAAKRCFRSVIVRDARRGKRLLGPPQKRMAPA